jgi:tRNA(Ile)-lysidine synthase
VRAGFWIPSERIGAVVVRSRRPGDRLQPLGGSGVRRLKEILVDRKVPRTLRDRLPLLCWEDQIVWVPGLTVAHPFRLRERGGWAWEAALEPA